MNKKIRNGLAGIVMTATALGGCATMKDAFTGEYQKPYTYTVDGVTITVMDKDELQRQYRDVTGNVLLSHKIGGFYLPNTKEMTVVHSWDRDANRRYLPDVRMIRKMWVEHKLGGTVYD